MDRGCGRVDHGSLLVGRGSMRAKLPRFRRKLVNVLVLISLHESIKLPRLQI